MVLPIVLGRGGALAWWHVGGGATITLAVAVVVALLLGFGARASTRARLVAGGLVLASVVAFAVTVVLRGTETQTALRWTLESQPQSATRYIVLPALLLLLAVVVVTADAVGLARPGARRWIGAVAVAALLLPALLDLRTVTARSDGPSWADEVEQAHLRCLGGSALVMLDTPPRNHPTRWGALLPCDRLAE